MLICRKKSDLKLEYALKRVLMPMSVSEFEEKLLEHSNEVTWTNSFRMRIS
ncbi:MAG: hypothetical protein H0W88_02455 [Parachlamydiaceae bacterium]|nr:hypothetical protein [Parachlamydiaceae bacterium]